MGRSWGSSPIVEFVAAKAGTSLSPFQLSRLNREIDQCLLGRSERAYLEWLQGVEGEAELSRLLASVCVHHTQLFRDERQLRAFQHKVLEPIARDAGRPLHLWSAGCATGEEVVTLLILLEEAGASPDSTVLGSDLSDLALEQARRLTYAPEQLERVPGAIRSRYFEPAEVGLRLKPLLARRARFVRHNLLDPRYPVAPDGGPFDVVMCRNVLIYLTEAACDQVLDGLVASLRPGGALVVSSTEPILKPHPGLSALYDDDAFFHIRRTERQPPVFAARPSRSNVETGAPAPVGESGDPRAVAVEIFEGLLAQGATDEIGEGELRRCLVLDPGFAQAHYVLGVLLEQRGEKAGARVEFGRALSSLETGASLPISFFLNDERLRWACQIALQRLGNRAD